MKKVKIYVENVHCENTEDVTGADDFYLMGDVFVTSNEHNRGIAHGFQTKCVHINDHENRKPNECRYHEIIKRNNFDNKPAHKAGTLNNGLIFEQEVQDWENIVLSLQGYDEDAANSWANATSNVSAIAMAVMSCFEKLSALGPWSIAVSALAIIIGLDKDDKLGESTFAVGHDRYGTYKLSSWNFRHGNWWSGWNYTVDLRVVIEKI